MNAGARSATQEHAGLYVRTVGPADGTPIVFLHPSGANAAAWDHHFAALSDRRCLAVDLPGHRHSRAVAWTSLEDAADRVAALIATQSCARAGGRAHVVGLSLGGSVALALLARHPEVLDRVIVDGAGALPNRWAWMLKAGVGLLSPGLHSSLVIRALAAALSVPADDVPTFAAGMRAIPPGVFRRAFSQAQDVRITSELLAVAVPVLFVAGERDPRATRVSNATLAAALPDAEARYLPDAGHAWMAGRPELHAAMVRAWVDGAAVPDELIAEPAPARR